jgi:rsbT co-antagonist protein RsbR
LDRIIDMLTRFAGGDLDARVPTSGAGDQLDVVATGLNMLAEELAWRLDENKAARVSLEEQVAERTGELEEKIRTVEAQNKEILQMSAPVLHVWNGVLVIPVIGTIDTHRAAEIMDSLLRSIEHIQAAVVVLDISGVSVFDADLVDHLVQTVRAARLHGAEAILTGVTPQIAQTLARLGMDARESITEESLRSGVKRALQIVANET